MIVRILHLEDDSTCAKLVQATIENGELPVEVDHAKDRDSYVAALQRMQYDAILSDYYLPDIDAREALKIVRRMVPDIPFIVVTGSVGEEVALELLWEGASEIVLKNRLDRLGAVVERLRAEVEAKKEHRRMEDALRRSEIYFRALIENSLDIISVLDFDGVVRFQSQSIERILGYGTTELVGRNAFDLVHPDDRDRVVSVFGRLVQAPGTVESTEFRFLHKNGSYITMESQGIRLDDPGVGGVLANSRDVSEHKRTEEALRDSESRSRAIYEGSNDAVMLLTEKGFFDCNRRTLEMFGVESKSEFVGMHPADVSPRLQPDGRDSLSAAQERIETAFSRGHYRFEWMHRRRNGEDFPAEVLLSAHDFAGERVLQATVRDITDRKKTEEELRRAHAETEQILSSISSILIGVDRDDRVSRWNATSASTFGLPPDRVLGRPFGQCPVRWDWTAILASISACRRDGRPARHDEIRYTRNDGKEGFLAITVNPINSPEGVYLGFLLLGADTTERRILESQLVQALKLESIGLLAAGIAHEINTPTQYVGDNTRFLRDAFSDLLKVQESFGQLLEGCRAGSVTPDQIANVDAALERADIGYLTEEIPKAIQQSLEGLERVTRIVRAMKDFAHPGTGEKTPVDINKAIDSTATVARNEWKYVADLVTDFAPSLPPVPCLPGELNQVFLNVIINAAHAIAAARGEESTPKGLITIKTLRDGDWVEIRVSDTGTGIPEAIRSRVFDPFFTTKGIGKGTGQGLSVSHDVVVKKHGGTISFETEVGEGTTFIIRLPLGAAGYQG